MWYASVSRTREASEPTKAGPRRVPDGPRGVTQGAPTPRRPSPVPHGLGACEATERSGLGQRQERWPAPQKVGFGKARCQARPPPLQRTSAGGGSVHVCPPNSVSAADGAQGHAGECRWPEARHGRGRGQTGGRPLSAVFFRVTWLLSTNRCFGVPANCS